MALQGLSVDFVRIRLYSLGSARTLISSVYLEANIHIATSKTPKEVSDHLYNSFIFQLLSPIFDTYLEEGSRMEDRPAWMYHVKLLFLALRGPARRIRQGTLTKIWSREARRSCGTTCGQRRLKDDRFHPLRCVDMDWTGTLLMSSSPDSTQHSPTPQARD